MFFQIRSEQVNLVRRKRNADAFARTFDGSQFDAKVDPASGDVLAGSPTGALTRYSFNDEGFVSRITSPMGRQWHLTSDSSGRATTLKNPTGSVASFGYDARGRLAQIDRDGQPLFQLQHDATGNVIRTAHADGTHEFLAYRHEKLLTGVSRRSGIAETFDWDNQQCLTAVVDGKGNETHYQYGRFTKPDRAIFADGSREEYKYDDKGQLTEFSQPGSSPVSVKADEQGRMQSATYSDGLRIRRDYNSDGRITAAAAGASETRFEYKDKLLVGEQSANAKTQYLHDESEQLTGLVYPSGASVAFLWDADGRIASLRDWSGALSQWQYDPSNLGWQVSYPGEVLARTRLLPSGLPQSVEVLNTGSGAKLWQYGIKYDAEDRIAFRHDSLGGQHTFTYDADGRLTQAGEENFTYDAADNLFHPRIAGATFNVLNQPVLPAGQGLCMHDERGNLTEGPARGGAWEFQWDARNRLTTALGPQSARITYSYDGLDRLIAREQNGHRIEYAWAGETLIAETERDSAGQVVREQEYLFVPGRFVLFATRINGEVFYAHSDPLGSPRIMTNSKGLSVWGATYDAFGLPVQVWGENVHQPWRFPGQYADDATGLHYNRFRVYSPFLGRYLSRDPLSYAAGTLNLYSYAGNDPINSADPCGLWGWKGILTAVAAVAVGVAVTAAVIAFAPIAVPALLVGTAIVAGGAAAGAVGFGLNQALNESEFCATCIAKEALKGLGVGAVAALPFAFLPASAGIAAFMGVGGLSGGIGYAGAVFTHPGTAWSWGDFAASVGIGAGTAGLGRFIAPRVAGLFRSEPVPTESYNRVQHYGRTPTAADRAVIGGESVDHDPPLVQRYYEGDPAVGEKPGFQQTPEERAASAQDRSRMQPSTKADQNKQGGQMSQYSKEMKKKYGF